MRDDGARREGEAPEQPAEGDDDDIGDDVDLALRHVTRQFPDELARGLLGADGSRRFSKATWTETQLTGRQRRLDRALLLEGESEALVLHIEWTLELDGEMPLRAFEYHVLTALALAAEARSRTPRRSPPTIETVVVVLTGRKRALPTHGEYRTSPEEKPFCGVRYRIVAIYQHTIAELRATGSPLWMIFAPLAKDADETKIAEILADLRAATTPETFTELGAAMAVLAEADQEKRGLRDVVVSLLPRELKMRSLIIREAIAQGREEGALRAFVHQFERRLGRKLSDAEQATLAARQRALGAERLGDIVLDSSRDALERWLATPDAA